VIERLNDEQALCQGNAARKEAPAARRSGKERGAREARLCRVMQTLAWDCEAKLLIGRLRLGSPKGDAVHTFELRLAAYVGECTRAAAATIASQ
jgi:hypothetical protein